MLIGLRFDPRQARAWHRALLGQLATAGHTVVVVDRRSEHSPWPDRLLAFEARLRGASADSSLARIDATAFPAATDAEPDLILDIDGSGGSSDGPDVWHLTADGAPGLPAILAAAALGRTPVIEIRHGTRVLAAGRAGTELPGLIAETATDLLGRTATLIAAALEGRPRSGPAFAGTLPRLGPVQAIRLAAALAGRRLASRVHRQLYRTPHWRVGWRRLDGPDLIDLRRHPDGGWHDLPDDGHHFYADPFPLDHAGGVTLFVEDYVHATGRGRIAALRFGPDGPLGVPEPVLERPYHLSYPFVFARDGAVWMIPETGEAGTVELYRATRYPGGWILEATLLSGLVAGDVTLHEAADGRWWMFATVKGGGAASDALHLWSAPDFRGPWTSHPGNPVLVDIAAARPAGRMTVRDGVLLRPVQDCRARYGGALGIARVTRLDGDGFAQEVDASVAPGPSWHGDCLHTVNRAGAFEFIDGSGRARRPWRDVLRP